MDRLVGDDKVELLLLPLHGGDFGLCSLHLSVQGPMELVVLVLEGILHALPEVCQLLLVPLLDLEHLLLDELTDLGGRQGLALHDQLALEIEDNGVVGPSLELVGE